MNAVITALKGVVIGVANAIPGVSGGTMAVILKTYDRLLEAISLSPAKLKKNWKFLLCMGLGMAAGVLLAAKVLGFLFEFYNFPTQLFFMGVILGSLPMILREIRSSSLADGNKSAAFRPWYLVPFLLGAALVLGITLVNGDNVQQSAFTAFTPQLGIYLAFALFLAAVSMLIPGVSGSFVLLILGGYQTVISAVNGLSSPTSDQLLILGCAAAGAAAGLLAGAKLISMLMKRFRTGVYCTILGLVAGSLYAVLPKFMPSVPQLIVGIFLLIFGAALPALMEWMGKRISSV